jgi:hypothetical protein
MRKLCHLLLLFWGFFGRNHFAHAQLVKAYQYDFESPIISISAKDYSIYVQQEKGIFNLLDTEVFASKKISGFCVSPLGNEMLIIEEKQIGIYRIVASIEKLLEIKHEFEGSILKIVPDAFGQRYLVLHSNGELYEVTNQLQVNKLQLGESIIDIAWSQNLQAFISVGQAGVFSLKNQSIQTRLPLEYMPTCVSPSDKTFEIIVGDKQGNVTIVDQALKSIKAQHKISTQPISAIATHQEDPHLFIADNTGQVFALNTLSAQQTKMPSPFKSNVALSSLFSKSKAKQNEYIISYANQEQLIIWDAKNFEPNYNDYIQAKLDTFKERFFKVRTNESEEAFLKRTAAQIASRIFEIERQRITDSLANSLAKASPKIDLEPESIRVEITPFKPVKIKKSEDLLASYLKLSEVHFAVNDSNAFYIKNLKLNNQIDGKQLVYNPILDKKIKDSLTKLAQQRLEEERKAIALAQQISKQELELKRNLTGLVQNLKATGQINEVDLSVSSRLVKEKDSTGADELNLKIDFVSKGVQAAVGAKTSDYPPGKYNLLDSPSAKTLVEFFLNSTEENLSQYLDVGTRVTFKITGSTDKAKIAGSLPYLGEFGDFNNFPFYFQGALNGMILNPQKGIESNSQLGFLRTYSVRDFIENYTDLFDSTKNKFIHYSEESDQLGAEYRKIQIEMTIHSIDKLLSLKKGNEVALSDVDVDIPKSTHKVNGYALIIGNEDYASYQSDLDTSQNVPFAAQDAESFKNYLQLMYGIPQENIILLINATYGEMSQAIAKFKKLMEFDGTDHNFIFYYSGHGMPHEQTNDPYIMPVDISGYTVEQAISLNELLRDFSVAEYNTCTLFIDACFSGVSRSPEPLIKVKGVGKWKVKKSTSTKSFFTEDFFKSNSTQPNFINPNLGDKMVLFSSSSGEETSLTDEANQHGLFTYHLLQKLKQTQGNVTIKSLFDYTKNKVGLESIMKYNKQQTPELISGDLIDPNAQLFN